LFIAFLDYILNYMHFAHTRAPRFMIFMTLIVRVVKKSFRKKKM